MKSLLFFLLLALFPIIISTSVDASPPRKAMGMPGGWSPIEDVGDPHVVEVAKFAVSEHNKEANSSLAFVRVVKGESQVVAGVNYKLVIEAEDDVGGAAAKAKKDGRYEAIVWEKEWEGFRKLTSFKLIH